MQWRHLNLLLSRSIMPMKLILILDNEIKLLAVLVGSRYMVKEEVIWEVRHDDFVHVALVDVRLPQ